MQKDGLTSKKLHHYFNKFDNILCILQLSSFLGFSFKWIAGDSDDLINFMGYSGDGGDLVNEI